MLILKLTNKKHMSRNQNLGYFVYIGDYTTQLYRDFKYAIIRIPINQPVFHDMS